MQFKSLFHDLYIIHCILIDPVYTLHLFKTFAVFSYFLDKKKKKTMYDIDFKQGNQLQFDNIGKLMLIYVKNQYAIEIQIKIQTKLSLGVEKAKSSEILHLVVIEVVQ